MVEKVDLVKKVLRRSLLPKQVVSFAEENNAENLLVIHAKKLAERYTKNWK
jgi:hypothetical protein